MTGKLAVPRSQRPIGVVLAHGAGAGQTHPWMTAMRTQLAVLGYATLTFNYRYAEAGRRAPDRLPVLTEVHVAAAERMAGYSDRVVLAGKSMGGRVGGHVAADQLVDAAGVAYFGYPLVAVGRWDPRDTSHLTTIAVPQLFVSGTRDRMGPLDLLKPVVGSVPNGTLVSIEGGDHSFVPLKSSGRSLDDTLVEAAAAFDRWCRGRIG
ncbi:MAG: alpha/beta family hydrolase [Acidimicrobiia bacterium]